MAAEICLSKLPQLIADPNAEFQVLLLILSLNNLALKTLKLFVGFIYAI
jgi:hypothetical protein